MYAQGLKLNGLKFVWGIVACCYPKEWSRNNINTFWCAITYEAHCIVQYVIVNDTLMCRYMYCSVHTARWIEWN